MSSSLSGSNGYGSGGNTTGSRTRGLSPGMKHIPGHHRFQQFTPEQMELFQSLFGQLGPDSFLGRLAGGDQSMFEEMERPALKQFSGLQGNLASRFSGMGMGARNSSGFQNTMNQASQDFAGQLQSQRMGLQQQAIKDLMGMSSNLLGQQPYGLSETPRNPSFLDRWLGLAANTMGVAARGNMGGM